MSFRAFRLNPWIGAYIAVAIAMTVSLCASSARAQPETAMLAQVLELNRKALRDYDNLNFDEARAELKEALALCDRYALGNHPVRARTYVHLGVVLLAADAEHPEVAIANFRRALQIQADVQVPSRFANPEVAQAFAEAKRDVANAARASSAPAPAPAPTEVPAPAPIAAPAPASEAPAAVETPAPAPPAPRSVAASVRDEEEEEDEETAAAGPRWLFAMGVGSGVGWVSGNGEVNSDQPLPSGFQPSSVIHLSPEIGYFVRPNLALSLQGRFQLISGTTPERSPNGTGCGGDGVCRPSKGASAVFARATYFFGSGTLRPFVVGTLGVGQIRHVVSLPHNDCGADPAHPVACVDTAAAGPFFFGPGGGVMIDLTPHFALTVSASALLGVSAFTAHLDLGGGVVVKL
jgi:hypothetical protein